VASDPEVYFHAHGIDPDFDQDLVLWNAPGSLHVDQIRSTWGSSFNESDLVDIPGPWGVALWDPTHGEVKVVVDAIGIMPLYWARTTTSGIAVAAWLAKLVDRDDVDDSVDIEGIVIDEGRGCRTISNLDRTRFRSVRQIPWGSALAISASNETSVAKYWDPEQLPHPNESLTLDECAQILRDALDLAIRDSLPEGNERIGAHISGGLDCTTMACRGNQILKEQNHGLFAGYSWAPHPDHVPRFEGDERGLLDDVASQEGIRIETVYPDHNGDWFFARDVNRYPQSTHMRERWVLPQAQSDGVHLMLSGWGGDELSSFNGRNVYAYLIRRGKLGILWKEVGMRAQVSTGIKPNWLSHLMLYVRTLVGQGPTPISTVAHALRNPIQSWKNRRQEKDIAAELREVAPSAAVACEERERRFRSAVTVRDFQLALLTNGHLQHRTSAWYQTGRMFDLYYRYPLLDIRVVKAALTLPWFAFRSEGWTRVAFRMAVQDWVPKSVAWNPFKFEPALFWPPERKKIEREQPALPAQEIDADMKEAMRLVGLTYRRGSGRAIDSASRVQPRPGLAPGV